MNAIRDGNHIRVMDAYAVKESIKEIDEHAFVNVLKTEQIEGAFYRHPNR